MKLLADASEKKQILFSPSVLLKMAPMTFYQCQKKVANLLPVLLLKCSFFFMNGLCFTSHKVKNPPQPVLNALCIQATAWKKRPTQ